MVAKEIIIKSCTGLESKAAARLIQKASAYKSGIWIEKEERKANAKSLLGILSLGIGKGAGITVTAEGEDEEAALKELGEFLQFGLGE